MLFIAEVSHTDAISVAMSLSIITLTPGAVVAVSFRFPNEQFIDEMRDPNSEETITFGSNIREQVGLIYVHHTSEAS